MTEVRMPVAVLAGGLATRLKPLTETVPKSLIEVAGEPFLAHQLRLFRDRGVRRAVLCVGHMGEKVEAWAGDGSQFGLQLRYSYDGPVQLGTGGAIRQALPMLGDRFLVTYGDSYLPCDYTAVAERFAASGKPGLMTVFRNEGRWDTSNVEFRGGRVVAYDKVNRTPAMQYIDYGLGAFSRSAFEEHPAGKPLDLADVYKRLVERGELEGFEVKERFYEIGSFQGIEDLTRYLAAPAMEET